jgi:hypothetical protein
MAGPAAAIVAGVVTAWLAVAHDDALVVDNYYKEGLAINRRLSQDAAAAAGRYVAQVLFSVGAKRVRVHLVGEGGLPAGLALKLIHPTRAALDRAVRLEPLGGAWYEASVDLPGATRWRVQLEDSNQRWRLTGEWRPSEGDALTLAAPQPTGDGR